MELGIWTIKFKNLMYCHTLTCFTVHEASQSKRGLRFAISKTLTPHIGNS